MTTPGRPLAGCRVILGSTAAIPGGVARHMLDLAAGLRTRGIDVAFLADRLSEHLVQRAVEAGHPVVALSEATSSDVVHLHLAYTFDGPSAALVFKARARVRCRVVMTEHLPRSNASDPGLEPAGHGRLARSGKSAFKAAEYAACHAVIVVSRGSARFLQTRYPALPSSIHVVENGVPIRADPGPWTDRHLTVWGVGELNRQKGWDLLVEAAGRAQAPWRVRILGSGVHRAALETLTARVAPGRVAFEGRRDDVAALLGGGGVLCAPSRWEASPYAALEAMSAALPVVAARVDGLEDMVVDGVTGRLVPPEDADSLAEALDEVTADVFEAQRLGEAGRARQAAHYTLDRMVSQTVAVYQECR